MFELRWSISESTWTGSIKSINKAGFSHFVDCLLLCFSYLLFLSFVCFCCCCCFHCFKQMTWYWCLVRSHFASLNYYWRLKELNWYLSGQWWRSLTGCWMWSHWAGQTAGTSVWPSSQHTMSALCTRSHGGSPVVKLFVILSAAYCILKKLYKQPNLG